MTLLGSERGRDYTSSTLYINIMSKRTKNQWQSGQMPQFQRTNSSFRLSRASSNTNATNPNPNVEAYYDNQSLRTLDRFPSAKPSVTYLDKLWTQIDVLDDVKNMSNQIRERGSFFNEEFSEQLNRLKQLQEKLIEVMASQQADSKGEIERPKPRQKASTAKLAGATTNSVGVNLDDSEDENDTPGLNQKFKDFFGDKKKTSNNVIYQKQNFDDVNNYVNDVKRNLETVSRSMKDFDDTTRDLW